MALCSFILEHRTQLPVKKLIPSQWEDFEVIYTSSEEVSSIPSDIERNIQLPYFKYVPWEEHNTWKKILDQSSGKYLTWIHPGEMWTENFLEEVRTLLNNSHQSLESNKTILPVGYGFIRTQLNKTVFCTDLMPDLKGKNSLSNNIRYPKFYNPALKYFCNTSLIRQTGLYNHWYSNHWQQQYSLNILSYITSALELSGGIEPTYNEQPLGFSVSNEAFLDTSLFEEYLSMIEDKRHLIGSNPWAKPFWRYLIKDGFSLFSQYLGQSKRK